jgi:K+-transporting ATPase ATPase C chain
MRSVWYEVIAMIKELRPAMVLLLLFTAVTGLAYPFAVLGIGQLVFPHGANGSMIERDGQPIGSALIGQQFTRPEYFHPRPSSAGSGYEADKSGGSNLGPSSRQLIEAIRQRTEALRAELGERNIPIDLVTASGSGLDPHISPQAASAQTMRVARARNLAEDAVWRLVQSHIEERTLSVFGAPRVNVLRLNLALDALQQDTARTR